jgi:hypothetical protein
LRPLRLRAIADSGSVNPGSNPGPSAIHLPDRTVWEYGHDRIAGIIALGDPVFNLSVRDTLIGWTVEERSHRLVNLLDAYVLGAVPPYNRLLGGKAVACLVRSRNIFDDFSWPG